MGYLKKALGENIKLIRKSKGLTQEKLAELIEIDQRQLARIEAGESFATAETLEKICKHAEISVKTLFNIENNETDNMTLKVIDDYQKNYKKLVNMIKRTALDDKKTEFFLLAGEALEKRIAREKLKGFLLALDMKP